MKQEVNESFNEEEEGLDSETVYILCRECLLSHGHAYKLEVGHEKKAESVLYLPSTTF